MKFVFSLLALVVLVSANPEEEGGAFEGDMVLNPEQIRALQEQRSKKNGFASIKTGLWLTNGKPDTIKYYVKPVVAGATNVIRLAINEYEKFTCLKFEKVQSRPTGSHIYFDTGNGCTSPVGRRYSGNRITLARGCWTKAIVMHEIGHSIGLFHEQSRPDRDNYVKILYENIQERYKFAFNKYKTSRIDSRGTLYDYDSLMHYGQKYFSKNGQLTIKTINPKDQHRIGQRVGFSEIDKQQINKMYRCGSSGGSGGSDCSDVRDADFCKTKIYGCNRWGDNWKKYMEKYCHKTCNFC